MGLDEDKREGMFRPESKLAIPFTDVGSTRGRGAGLELKIKS